MCFYDAKDWIAASQFSVLKKLQVRALLPTQATLRGLTPSERETLAGLLEGTVECMFHPSFRRRVAEKAVLGPMPAADLEDEDALTGDELEHALLLETEHGAVRLTRTQEQYLFMRYNYCRYRVMQALRRFNGKRLTAPGVRQVLRWETLGRQTQDLLVRINRPLVMAMAKRASSWYVDTEELIGEGNLALIKSVDRFDCTRGFKFSTYACRAILAAFARLGKQTVRYRDLFPIDYDPGRHGPLEAIASPRDKENLDDYEGQLKRILADNLADLSPREFRVLRNRFGMHKRGRRSPSTLQQVADVVGVSRERVRQIQISALEKLRDALFSDTKVEAESA